MALANGYATNEQTKLLPRDDDVAHVAPTRRLGVIAIFGVCCPCYDPDSTTNEQIGWDIDTTKQW